MIARSRVRLRTRSGQRTEKQDAEDTVKKMLEEYRERERELEEVQGAIGDLKKRIEATMVGGKLTEVFHGVYEAKYAAPATRSSTVIDPQKFSDEVSPEEFWECVTISVTKAREVMSERELKEVSTVTQGESKPPVLTISKSKKKGK